LRYFTADRALGVSSADLYSLLMPEVPRPDKTSSAGGDGDVGTRYRTPITAKRVQPLALFAGVLHTDENGLVNTYFDLPEFVGKLRLMAVAYAGSSCGCEEANVLVRGPLLVQSSFPRFVAPGDRFSAPIV